MRTNKLHAYACLFTKEFVKAADRSESLPQSPLFRIGSTPLFKLPAPQADYVRSIFHKMLAEQQGDYAFKGDLIRTYVQLLIHEALHLQPADTVVQPKNAATATVTHLRVLGMRALAVQADVAQVADIERLFATAQSTFGKLDIVVANAGVELVSVPVADFTEEQYDRLFNVNTKGAFFTLQKAAAYVADHGRILYAGSSTAGYPRPGYALHGGSKVAPEYLVRMLAQEVGKRGIAVNALVPTATQGAGVNASSADNARMEAFIKEFLPDGPHRDSRRHRQCRGVFASALASFVSGQCLLLSGGGLACPVLLPAHTTRLIRRPPRGQCSAS